MNRRQLLKGGCGLLLLSGVKPVFAAAEPVAYTREVYEEALSSGKSFMLDFSASW